MNKLIFGLLWLGFVGYAFFLAPPDRANTLQLIIDLSTGKWQDINPAIVALFNLMGILPAIYACLMLIDGKTQKLRAGLFCAASFGVGAFAILPYLALRVPNSSSQSDSCSKRLLFSSRGYANERLRQRQRQQVDGIARRGIIKVVDSRWLGIALTIATIVLLGYGIGQGDWLDFSQQWQTNRFIHVMSLDFCLLSLLLPVLINDDIDRRNFSNPQLVKIISLIPLFGGLYYLCVRPQLPDPNPTSVPNIV
ncbi:DUF2834 domain-containing protein [Chamaesiphon sp. VAR_48_metabat_403]|uniref:DUF2834 domain-containing protein n=1 Tax=Chamaesiphon sp. VAR_48_metabat_403 TaxID=2964700 RepID=UPI00286E6258|nr:DUF2834 domain-containing protein [Chamaesiphon sp. VAR_48_metabat_403]